MNTFSHLPPMSKVLLCTLKLHQTVSLKNVKQDKQCRESLKGHYRTTMGTIK